ncbi:MAG: dCTP deaminase [Fervidicoccaceae archaeon]
MILGDRDLRYYIESGRLVVSPYYEEIVRENGLDLRLAPEIARLRRSPEILDVRSGGCLEDFYVIERGESFVVWPGEHVLLSTIEYLKLPDDLMAFVNLRSTYARLGLKIPPTIVDAGFEGTITIEVMGGSFPIRLYAGERFVHLIFSRLTTPVQRPYAGVYQGQRGIKPPNIMRECSRL